MITIKQILFLWVVSSVQAASTDKKSSTQQKRALDYNYPFPIISFQEQPQKFYVETIKSVSPLGQRYLPPTGPTIAALPALKGAKSPPISVSFNAFEPEQQQSGSPKPTQSAATPSAAPSSTATTQTKKRPGGLGSFKYYGGSGTSSASKSDSAAASSSAPAPTTAPKPAEPAPVTPDKPVAKASTKPAAKSGGYDYPTPKNNRKPSKKEQKLADSKPEESGVGYQYDVPGHPGVVHGGLSGAASGSAGGMGLSYMRQSSPYYSFHVMLD